MLCQMRLRRVWFGFFASCGEARIIGERCVLDKKIKVKFDTVIHRLEDLVDCVHIDFRGPTKAVSLGRHWYFVPFVDLSLCWWVYPMRQRL